MAADANVRAAQRRLRDDIFSRSLGRDIVDVENVDAPTLERLFLHVCKFPGDLFNESSMASDLDRTRPTVNKYADILRRAFLIFPLRNLASAVKGQPKMYLVAPSLRSAMFHLNEDALQNDPELWGKMAENAVASTLLASADHISRLGFWRKQERECDFVVEWPGRGDELLEAKRSGELAKALPGLRAADTELPRSDERTVRLLTYNRIAVDKHDQLGSVVALPVAMWLYVNSATKTSGPFGR